MLHLIMVISTLVMTAVRVFGEFIQKALEDSGQYSVTLVNDQKELIRLVQTGEIQAAVLDMELEPDPIKLVTKINLCLFVLTILNKKEKLDVIIGNINKKILVQD